LSFGFGAWELLGLLLALDLGDLLIEIVDGLLLRGLCGGELAGEALAVADGLSHAGGLHEDSGGVGLDAIEPWVAGGEALSCDAVAVVEALADFSAQVGYVADDGFGETPQGGLEVGACDGAAVVVVWHLERAPLTFC